LGIKEEESVSEKTTDKIVDKILPENNIDIALDEKFADSFTQTGGKFIYCLNEQEVLESLKNIILENNWNEILSFDETLNNLLDRANINYSNKTGTNSAFFSNCEALIANDGSILISSNQTKGRQLSNLPYDFLIIANIKDITEDRSDGLRSINLRSSKGIPSGITTIKGPKTVTGSNNILDSGSINTSKNIYLLLVE